MVKPVVIRNKTTGETRTVKSYGNVWVDAKGNSYHHSQWELVAVKEV